MRRERRWDPCIAHRDGEADGFLGQYFGQADRKILLVAGAGFDPRARTVALRLNDATVGMRTLLVKEQRPDPAPQQSDEAEATTKALLTALTDARIEPIRIFGSDGAVVGGRRIIALLSQECLEGLTDIVIDISALSVGISFPVIRYFVERLERAAETANLHVFVAHNPLLDASIRALPTDAPGYVHGFKGGLTLSSKADAARLWLPQLASGRSGALGRLYDFVEPDDICPVLPFPAIEPRLGDALAAEYQTELEDTWEVDTRNIVYADERDPLDLYRTILKLDDLRRPVFKETGGSVLVLSPLGSKVMALGALMAALERDLPVAYLESLGYELQTKRPATADVSNLIHIWLEGDAYPSSRAPRYTEGETF